MKIVIEGKPEELSQFTSQLLANSHIIARNFEEQIASAFLLAKDDNKKKDNKVPEVPSGGYYQ